MSVSTTPYSRIFLGEAVIYLNKAPNLILATDGLCSCIGFAGYERIKQIGFLIHFFTKKQVEDFYSRGIQILSEVSGMASLEFHCVIKGSSGYTSSNEIIDAIHKFSTSNENILFNITSELIVSKKNYLQSLSFSIPGEIVGDYNHIDDPHPREKTAEEKLRDGTNSGTFKLRYLRAEVLPEGVKVTEIFAERMPALPSWTGLPLPSE